MLRLYKTIIMKKILLSVAALVLFTAAIAQDEYKKRPTFGFQFIMNDFQTAADLRSDGLSNVLKAKQWYKTGRMSPGIALNYLQGLSNHVDFAASLSGSFLDYPVPNRARDFDDRLLLEAAATANLKLVTDKYWFNPFLTLGVGASKYKGYFGAFLPAGVGIQIRAAENTFVLLNAQYRIPVTENVAYHFYHPHLTRHHYLCPAPQALVVEPQRVL